MLHDKFFWTSAVTSVAVTATARGIASKFLLLGTTAGQVPALYPKPKTMSHEP